MDHTFLVPVFRLAPHLGALIASLRAQTLPGSAIVLTSSTPSAELAEIARGCGLALHVNPQRLGIAADWNFALAKVTRGWVTLAHQDDLFAPEYVAELTQALTRHPGAVLAYSDYAEHTACGPRPPNLNLRIKRALSARAFGSAECIHEPRRKLRLLELGNPICCPSVMLDRTALGDFRFPAGLTTNLDWMAWLELARRPGGFVYVRRPLVSKGIHARSETTAAIASRARAREDRLLFEAIWPRPIAQLLSLLYRLGYRANRTRRSALADSDAHDADGDGGDADPLQR
jgi:hypothetical protein